MTDYYLEDGTFISEDEAYALYDDMLDETHDDVEIGYITFTASQILNECDPIAYETGFSDYTSAQVEDGVWFEDDPTEDEEEDEDD